MLLPFYDGPWSMYPPQDIHSFILFPILVKNTFNNTLYIWGQSPRNESSVALGSIVVIAMYSVYVLKIDPPTTFKIFPKIDLLMSCSLCPQSLGHENISF